jgi:chitin synthase
MASNSDVTHQPPGFDASTLDSASYNNARPRHDSKTLLMLPAPLAVNRPLTSSTSSVGMSRSSEEHYNSDNGSGYNLRLTSSPQSAEHCVDSTDPAAARLLPPSPYNSQSFGKQNSVPQPPSMIEAQNPFRSSATSYSHEDHSVFTPDYDEPSSGGGGGRGVRLMDGGPVPGPEGVRRVSRPRRPTSQTAPQNRYSRNSNTTFNLPAGAAPPQQNFGF